MEKTVGEEKNSDRNLTDGQMPGLGPRQRIADCSPEVNLILQYDNSELTRGFVFFTFSFSTNSYVPLPSYKSVIFDEVHPSFSSKWYFLGWDRGKETNEKNGTNKFNLLFL